MQKRKIVANSVLAMSIGWLGLSRLNAVEDNAGHSFGEWPAISAMIHDEFQKNLNLEDKDFLFEIWFSPMPVLPNKGAEPNVLISKKCADLLRGYTLAYEGSHVSLTLCDRNTELVKDHNFSADAGLAIGEWCYLAAAYAHKNKTLTFYKNGVKLKEYTKVELGDLSNKDTFNIGYYENRGSSPAHCRIREARVWKLKGGLPDNMASVVETHNRDTAKVSDLLAKGADYSRWTFSASNEDIADQGNNGNSLCYVPFGYKDRVKLKPFPGKPSGKTCYVDNRNPQASDDGEGTKEKPFRTIKRGLKATYPGDVLHICAGTYREGIYPRAGENGNPVTVEGEEGTIIMGSEPLPGWERKADGIWEIANWTGKYERPADPKESDARSDAGNLIFVDDEPMDFIKTRLELVPGTWTAEPSLERGPKTILLCPLPGIDPAKAQVEITVSGLGGLTANKFTHIKGLRFLRCSAGLRGIGNILENCTIEWVSFVSLGIGGQDQIVRNNRLLWGGNSAVGGSSARLLFENNLLSYNGWRNYGQGWHGGAIKLIPGNTDHIMRNNELCYNDIGTIWYDAWNQGNLVEGNICRDNSGHGGIFDEISFGNTFKNNLCYNNYGHGICIAESHEERLFRNILFNNYGLGISFRGGNYAKEQSPEVRESLNKEFGQKLDVRRYQGFVTYEREKKLRDMVDMYWCRYSARSPEKRNEVAENVIFDNCAAGKIQIGHAFRYGKGKSVSPDIANKYRGNIYWSSTSEKIINDYELLDLKKWQELSSQDKDSLFMNPYDNMDKMPEWFREKFKIKKDEFRPIGEVMDGCLSNIKKSTARTVLMSRLLRSKTLEQIKFTDPMLFGVYFNMDGKRCASLWSKGVGTRDFIVPGVNQILFESKYLKRKTVETQDSRVSVLVGEAPVTLIGIAREIKEDRSVVIDVPMWTEPGKPIPAKLTLENAGSSSRDYDLTVGVGKGWKIENEKIRKTLAGGEKMALEIPLIPPEDLRQGMFQFNVAGKVSGKEVAVSKSFGIGSLLVLKHVKRGLNMDGDLADWGDMGIPNGIAEAREQVVFGAENWKGTNDLSAKIWLQWHESRELYMAIEVTDDKLVTNHGKDAPLKSDSIQVMVDVRAEWKHYMKECTPGTFMLTLVPGNETNPATASYGRLRVGSIRGVASKKTEKGYIMEVNVHFHTAELEDPGWVAKRPLRIGVLVNDSDDPEGKDRKATIGVWRTADDAAENCASLTTFVTEK